MQKIVRNTFIACLIPTIIWALGHTLYPDLSSNHSSH
ncbi:hypothetical protein Q0F98_09475 [Paenibacillus amylolyticus]|nr:hypothetical protein Q0F98_09475 [Paenibacillus amylolyticus]